MAEGGKEAVRVDEDVVGFSEVKALEKRIRELELVLGKKPWRTRFVGRPSRLPMKKLISRLPSLPDEGSL
jgi:transposase